jgi:hypothetical protein
MHASQDREHRCDGGRVLTGNAIGQVVPFRLPT